MQQFSSTSVRAGFLLLAVLAAAALPAAAQAVDHSAWDRVLAQYRDPQGRVDYAALKQNPAALKGYVDQIAARSPDSHPAEFPSRDSQMAYWLNAYNALTIWGVVEGWPTRSVRDLGFLFGFFRNKKFTVGARPMTLDNIEHDTLRKRYSDPRIHFGVNCASIGCPRLPARAFTPENLDAELDRLAREFFNDAGYFRIEPGRNLVTTSKILDWYGGDFEKYIRARGQPRREHYLVTYARAFLDEANLRALDALKNPRVDFFDYDWAVNDMRNPPPGSHR
jgi:hypothetical protein